MSVHRARLLALLVAAPLTASAGRGPDTDGDKVVDDMDDCVYTPGTRKLDGCPDTAARTRSCEGVVSAVSGDELRFTCDHGRSLLLYAGEDKEFPLEEQQRATAEYWRVKGMKNVGLSRLFVMPDGTLVQPTTPPSEGDLDCFVTTAVSRARGLPDDCADLQDLRAYRDRYLADHPDVQTYYRIAPGIVAALAARPDAAAVWRVVWEDYLRPILGLVRAGEDAEAHAAYRVMVEDLQALARA